MNVSTSNCDRERIHRFLDGDLDPREETDFFRHLDRCTTCRETLHASAAEPELWRQAESSLTEDEVDLEYSRLSSHGDGDDYETGSKTVPIAQLVLDSLAPTDDPHMLGRLGHYEVVGVVGVGGMGVVLKAFDRPLNRYVAIKVLSPQLASSAAARKRFSREAQAAAAVLHENVIPIHNVSEANGLPYLVMPYVPGASLQKRLDRGGPLDIIEVLRIGQQIAAGLSAAHSHGLVHRDVKPANILLEDGVERVQLTDFGLARATDDASLTCSGVIAGTPQFMSPEQACGEGLDGRSDLFSLASLLYTMCAGHPPFRAESAVAVLRRISDDRPRPIRQINPQVPDWLAGIIDRLHAKDPNDRFQSAAEVATLFAKCLAHVQNPTACPLPHGLAVSPIRRLLRSSYNSRRVMWTTGVLAGLSVVLGLATAGYWASQRNDQIHDNPAATVNSTLSDADTAQLTTVELQQWSSEVSELRSRVQSADDGWLDGQAEPWSEAESISDVRKRIQRLDAELSPGSL